MNKTDYIHSYVLCAFFTGFTAVLSQINVPVGVIPINMATFSVLCAGAFLGPKHGALSQIIYLILGVCGVPVFAGFQAGLGRIAGPTGGFLVGYAAAPVIIGIICVKFAYKPAAVFFSMFCGFAVYMSLGTLWYMFSAGVTLSAAIIVCVMPFLFFDIAKICLAVYIVIRTRPVLVNNSDFYG